MTNKKARAKATRKKKTTDDRQHQSPMVEIQEMQRKRAGNQPVSHDALGEQGDDSGQQHAQDSSARRKQSLEHNQEEPQATMEDITNDRYWTLAQVLAWMHFRDADHVAIAKQIARHEALDRIRIMTVDHWFEGDPPGYFNPGETFAKLRKQMEEGVLKARAISTISEHREVVPPEQWADLIIQSNKSRDLEELVTPNGTVRWYNAVINYEKVLKKFPTNEVPKLTCNSWEVEQFPDCPTEERNKLIQIDVTEYWNFLRERNQTPNMSKVTRYLEQQPKYANFPQRRGGTGLSAEAIKRVAGPPGSERAKRLGSS